MNDRVRIFIRVNEDHEARTLAIMFNFFLNFTILMYMIVCKLPPLFSRAWLEAHSVRFFSQFIVLPMHSDGFICHFDM